MRRRAAMERDGEARGLGGDERGVSRAFGAAQSVVEVRDGEAPRRTRRGEREGVEQRDGIGTAGDGDEQRGPAGHKA